MAAANDPPKPAGVIKFDARGMPIFDESKLDAVIERQGQYRVTQDEQLSLERRIDLLRRWGVAVQDARIVCTPSELQPTVAVQYADEFLAGRGVVDDTSNSGDERQAAPRKKTIAIFAGPLGVGKTIAATHVLANGYPQRIVGEWSSQEHPVFVHAEAVFAASKMTGENDTKQRRAFARARTLVIDDMGLERDPRKTFQPYMDWLINTRYGGDGWTVLTTNLPIEDFRKRYGERIYDRLRHRACWYEIAHESLRGKDG